jgi:hypothetical protein
LRARADAVEGAVSNDISVELGEAFDQQRFIPYVVMHEFEGLLFSDPARFANGIGKPALASQLQVIRDGFFTPEEINDSPETAPSKRVKQLYASYQKPLMGILAAEEIGLAAIRSECPLFDNWVKQLEERVGI